MFAFDSIIVMLIVSGFGMAGLGLYSRRFIDRVPAATPYVLLMFCAAAWAILYALDLLTPSLPLKIFFHNLRFLFLPFIAVLEVWLVVAYVKKTDWIRRDIAAIALIIPVISVILAITSPFHTLFRYNFSINTAGPVPVLQYSESTFFTLYTVYSFLLLALAVVLLILETHKKGTLHEMPTILLLIALAFPTALNFLFQAFQFPLDGINLTPILLWIAAILYTVALFRFQFLNIVPIARSRLIEALSKPVLVLDTDGRVIDMNPAAYSLFSLPPSSAFGKPIDTIVTDWPEFLFLCKEKTTQKKDLTRVRQDGTHYYIGSAEPLLTHEGIAEGHLIFLQDITDLKKTERALQEKTEELDQYFTTSLDLFCIADTAGYFRRLNPEWEKSLGYSLAELEGKRFLDFVHPDDLQATLDALSDLSSQKTVLNFTNRYRHRDGTYRWIEWRSYPKGERIFAAARDITNRKQVEGALSESEEKYRTLVESSFDGIAIHQDGIIVYANQTAARILGSKDPGAFIGKPAIDIVAPSYRERIALRVVEAPEHDLGLIREQFLKMDGTCVDVDVTTAPGHWKGKPAAYVTFRDITAQVHAENALRESEERYRSIIENIQDVYFRFDEKDQLIMVSPSGARMFGYTSVEEMLGLFSPSLWKNGKDRSLMLEAMEKQGGAILDWEAEFIKKDGSTFWVSISAHRHRGRTGICKGTEGIIRDISERRKTADALKTALNKLNMLSSITRHDIMNQIMGLRTFLELSREDLKGTRFAEFVEKEDQAAEAIQQQIEFTKFYEDIGVNAPKWQDPAAVIHEAAMQLDLSGIKLVVTITGTEIFADPLIVKVFFNLMENSLRHGERVTVMDFSSRETETGLIITFRDNGVGISSEDKKKLFQKGFGKHTGLGLFLSQQILAITGITITENGEPGTGVRFEIAVPKDAYRPVE
ncbi:MAG: PAS domain S-box protein [Methanoregula sp.]